MVTGNLVEWLTLGAMLMFPTLAGIGFIIKMLYGLDKRLDTFGVEFIRVESGLRADHKGLEMKVEKCIGDHETRIRDLERKVK
jgi:hypothetical protein